MSQKQVKLEWNGNSAWIWLTDPKGLNAMGTPFFNEFKDTVAQLEANSNTRCAIFATREKNFSVGLDLKEFGSDTPESLYTIAQGATRLFDRVAELPFPTLALFKGYSIGGALELGAGCDFRFASEEAQISLPAARIGFFNPAHVAFRLARLVGLARAKELMLTTKMISAHQAQDWGILNSVVSVDKLIEAGEDWAKMISELDTTALVGTKKLLNSAFDLDFISYQKLESEELRRCALRSEPIQRMRALLANRGNASRN